jgi:hypothetical protein
MAGLIFPFGWPYFSFAGLIFPLLALFFLCWPYFSFAGLIFPLSYTHHVM